MDWRTYDPRAAGANCDACPLRSKRFVPPEGPTSAELVLVGEGPGQHEEMKRRPFIGPSGMLLNDILKEIGVDRSRVWITNTILCRAEVPEIKGSKRYNLDSYMAWLRAENAKRRKRAAERRETPQLLASPFDCCRQRLLREVQWHEQQATTRGDVNGAVVMPLGNYALRALTGKTGIMKWRGSPLVQQAPEI